MIPSLRKRFNSYLIAGYSIYLWLRSEDRKNVNTKALAKTFFKQICFSN